MLMLVASAVAMENPWDCFEATSLPDLQGVDADPSVAWEIAWAEVEGWVDACLVRCEGQECWEASCTTAEGAVVAYRSEVDGGAEITFTVVAPDGWAWSTLTAVFSSSSSSDDWTRQSAFELTLAWSGTLHEALPVDGTLSTGAWSDVSTGSIEWDTRSATWDDGVCRWSWSRSLETSCHYVESGAASMNGVSGTVAPLGSCGCVPWGVYDGDDVGVVDPATWAPLGTTDADGDGWYDADDCDDADAAVYPCATETVGDAVDGDCDGRVDDEDEDGWSVAEGDCDDLSDGANPGATERDCDGVDQDCDGEDPCADTGEHGFGDDDDPGEAPAEEPRDAAPLPERGCGGSGMALLLPLVGLRRRRGLRDPCPVQVDATRPMPRPS